MPILVISVLFIRLCFHGPSIYKLSGVIYHVLLYMSLITILLFNISLQIIYRNDAMSSLFMSGNSKPQNIFALSTK